METAAAFLAARYPFVNELLTRRLALVVAMFAGVILATNAITYGRTISSAENNLTVHGPAIGGDFVVFFAAARGAAENRAGDIYDAAKFDALLREVGPPKAHFGLTWQYPPTMLLVVWPLALFPFLASFAVWAGATGALYLAAMRAVWGSALALFLVVAAPATLQSLITGQTGFLTAALLAGAALWADKRPVLAGLAAGLLTIKPQLGLLLPLAFLAAGCWRAFAVAALTATGLALASLVVFGAETWISFYDAVVAHGARLQIDTYPYYKLVSAFGGAVMLGAPVSLALGGQIAATLLVACIVALVWRRTKDALLRVAVLCAAAPLATPYAFYYEAAMFVPAMLAVARAGAEGGWLRGERLVLAFLWIAPLSLPGARDIPGFPLSFCLAALAFFMAARRAAAAPDFRRQSRPLARGAGDV